MLVAPEKAFHQKIGENLHVDSGKDEGRIEATPARAFLRGGQFLAEAPLELPRQVVEVLGEVLVVELNDIDVHQFPVIGVVVDNGTDLGSKLAKSFAGKWVAQIGEHAGTAGLHLLLIGVDHALEEDLFGRVVGVDGAGRSSRQFGNVPDIGAMVAMAGEQAQGGLFDTAAVLLGTVFGDLWHVLKLKKRMFVYFQTRMDYTTHNTDVNLFLYKRYLYGQKEDGAVHECPKAPKRRFLADAFTLLWARYKHLLRPPGPPALGMWVHELTQKIRGTALIVCTPNAEVYSTVLKEKR